MNSEELEVSLRSEFETYLKNVLAEMQQEVSALQEKVTTELERHKSQLDEVFANAVSNFAKEHSFEESFRETVIEHLRLARDEGAQITAMAIAQAEDMEKETAPSVGIKEIYDAVNDISNKPSQSEILKSLVHHATHFAPRGAFFIVKNEHLVGWRVFGKEKGAAEEKVREVFLSISSDSVLSEAVKTLDTVNNTTGGFHADAEVLRKLEFGEPQKMVTIPLIARGRGVAVLYADYGNEGEDINIEALETLVRVAGLTVEVLASNKTVTTGKKSSDRKDEIHSNEVSIGETGGLSSEVLANYHNFTTPSVAAPAIEPAYVEPAYESSYIAPASVIEEPVAAVAQTVEETVEPVSQPSDFVSSAKFEDYQTEVETVPVNNYSPVSNIEQEYSNPYSNNFSVEQDYQPTTPSVEFESFSKISEPVVESVAPVSNFETSSWSAPVEEKVESNYAPVEEKVESDYKAESDYVVESPYQVETEKYADFGNSSWTSTQPTESTPGFSAQEFAQNFAKETDPTEYAKDFSYQVEEPAPVQAKAEVPVAEEFVPTKEQTFEIENNSAAATPKSRLSERNVDLPIEVGEDERRLHNDARRFARLLVSEIKLYNEQKVKEGRDANDLYDRLKEAIDRSREMYDKRVQPPVAAKFDYFHYELVNTLAEGDDNKLGADYPGAMV